MRKTVIVTMGLLLAIGVVPVWGWYANDFEGDTVGATPAGWIRYTVQYDGADHSDTSNKSLCYNPGAAATDFDLYQTESYSDFTYVVKFQAYDDEDTNWGRYAAVIFRAGGNVGWPQAYTVNHYQVWLGDGLYFRKRVDNVNTLIATDGYAYVKNSAVWLRIDAVGNNFKMYTSEDGVYWTLRLDVNDDAFSSGYVGLKASYHEHWDDIVIAAPMDPPPPVPPSWYEDDFESYGNDETVPGWSSSSMKTQYDGCSHEVTGNQVYCWNPGSPTTVWNVYDEEYGDFTYVVKMKSCDTSQQNWGKYDGVIFRYVSSGNYYRTYFDEGFKVLKYAGGTGTDIGVGSFSYVPGSTNWVRVDAVGSQLSVYTSGDGETWTLQAVANDSTYNLGKIGLVSSEHSHFDDLSVREYTGPPLGWGWKTEDFESYAVETAVPNWSDDDMTVQYDGVDHSDTSNQVYCWEPGYPLTTRNVFAGDYSDFLYVVRMQSYDTSHDNWGKYDGVLFRYQGTGNYYRTYFDEGFKVLKYVNGTGEDIGAGSFQYAQGSANWVAVYCQGNHILAYTSPDKLIWTLQADVNDDTYRRGKIGVVSSEHSHFDDLSVSAGPAVCGDPGTAYAPADLSGPDDRPDCRVDVYDLAMFAETWLLCTDPAGNVQCNPDGYGY